MILKVVEYNVTWLIINHNICSRFGLGDLYILNYSNDTYYPIYLGNYSTITKIPILYIK